MPRSNDGRAPKVPKVMMAHTTPRLAGGRPPPHPPSANRLNGLRMMGMHDRFTGRPDSPRARPNYVVLFALG